MHFHRQHVGARHQTRGGDEDQPAVVRRRDVRQGRRRRRHRTGRQVLAIDLDAIQVHHRAIGHHGVEPQLRVSWVAGEGERLAEVVGRRAEWQRRVGVDGQRGAIHRRQKAAGSRALIDGAKLQGVAAPNEAAGNHQCRTERGKAGERQPRAGTVDEHIRQVVVHGDFDVDPRRGGQKSRKREGGLEIVVTTIDRRVAGIDHADEGVRGVVGQPGRMIQDRQRVGARAAVGIGGEHVVWVGRVVDERQAIGSDTRVEQAGDDPIGQVGTRRPGRVVVAGFAPGRAKVGTGSFILPARINGDPERVREDRARHREVLRAGCAADLLAPGPVRRRAAGRITIPLGQ